MKDPYTVLGLSRNATQDDIKRTYRRLARTWHPDSNPDPGAEDRFKDLSAAYELLSDPTQRARFDRGEIDAAGRERGGPQARPRGRPGGGARRPGAGAGRFGFHFDAEDLFDDLFKQAQQQQQRAQPKRGADNAYELSVPFEEAIIGATRRVTLLNGKTLEVRISPGTEDGQKLRLKGQGTAGVNGGPPGDAMVEIKVLPHPFFQRKGNDIVVDVPVTVKEAVLGARITVPIVGGKVAVAVPKGANTGTVLRLKGKGVPHGGGQGDQLVKLKVVLPEAADLQFETFVRHWLPTDDADPRLKAGLI